MVVVFFVLVIGRFAVPLLFPFEDEDEQTSRRRRKVQSQICVGGSETCVWKDDDNALLDPFLLLLVFDFLTPPPPCAFLNAVVFQNKLSCAVPCRATANENKWWFVVVALSKVCTIFAVDM